MNQAAVRFLLEMQDTSGGWGYTPNGTPGVEPTAVAVLALAHAVEAASAVKRAQEWLVSIQNEDGGWGLNGFDKRSGWHTVWAVLALRSGFNAGSALKRGREWLAAAKVYREENKAVLQAFNQAIQVDFSLAGWSWGPGEASWVQPTALAMLALKTDPSITSIQSRLDEAVRYLDNRRIPGGGWNVGNPAMFDGVLPAHTLPTALALLALQKYQPGLILQEDIEALRLKAAEDGGAKALGWAILALRMLGQEDAALRQQLLAQQQADGGWESSPFSSAVALLGLEGVL